MFGYPDELFKYEQKIKTKVSVSLFFKFVFQLFHFLFPLLFTFDSFSKVISLIVFWTHLIEARKESVYAISFLVIIYGQRSHMCFYSMVAYILFIFAVEVCHVHVPQSLVTRGQVSPEVVAPTFVLPRGLDTVLELLRGKRRN